MKRTHFDLDGYVTDTVQRMTAVGVYKPQFDAAIQRYSEMRQQYDILTARWKRERYRVYVKTKDGDASKRNPLVVAIEGIRKDLTTLESLMGLNPAGLLKVDEKAFADTGKKKSGIARLLDDMTG